jgi:hypothetical protein
VIESVLSHRDAIRAIIDSVDAETEAEDVDVDVDSPTTAEESLDLGPGEDGWVPTPTAPGMSAVPAYATAPGCQCRPASAGSHRSR